MWSCVGTEEGEVEVVEEAPEVDDDPCRSAMLSVNVGRETCSLMFGFGPASTATSIAEAVLIGAAASRACPFMLDSLVLATRPVFLSEDCQEALFGVLLDEQGDMRSQMCPGRLLDPVRSVCERL